MERAKFAGVYTHDGAGTIVVRYSWEQRKLIDEVASIDTGKSKFTPQESGKYEILGSTSVIGYDDTYDYEGDFLLTARVGANAGELYRYSGKVKISDNTVFIKGEQLDFVYYALLHFDIKRLSFGTGQPLVKASELKVQEIMMPVEDTERTVIGEYFANLDNLITLHQRKLEQRLFFGCRFFIQGHTLTWCPATKEQGIGGSEAPRPTRRNPIWSQRRGALRRRTRFCRQHYPDIKGGKYDF